MRGSGWTALAEAAAGAADASLAICCYRRENEWRAALWADEELRPLLAGCPATCEHDEALFERVRGARVLIGEPIPILKVLASPVRDEVVSRLPGSAALFLELKGRPPAAMWLGFRAPPDRARVAAIAALIGAVANHLPSRYQLFVDEAPLVFISVDQHGVIADANSAVAKMGYRPEELIGQPSAIIYAPGERERLLATLSVHGPELIRQQLAMRHRSGEVVPVDVLVGVIRDEDGAPIETAGLGRDLRPERQAEHHRRLDAVGRLASGVAHELNNPLLTVVGNAEMLMNMKLSVAAGRRAERVLAGARRCQDVVDGLLRLRITRKELHALVELEPVIRAAVRAVVLELELGEVLPQLELPSCSVLIKGEAVDLQQAIAHLLRNAFQAIEGRPAGRVSVRLGIDGDQVQITVADDGPGMTPEVLGRAFEPFFTTREVGKGRGLGLSVAMGVVQDHGGTMELRSSEGGTAAIMHLPRV